MKKITILLGILALSFTGYCTVWTVNNSGNTFTPADITITYGDTVNFVIVNSHDAREVSQMTYQANGNTALAGGFQTAFGGGMVLPAQLGVGVHYYVCTPHAAMGMKGTITVLDCTNPGNPGAITGSASVCEGSVNTYDVAAVSGATSYVWTLPNGWTGSSTSNSITATAGANAGNITVTAVNFCGSSTTQTFAVSINGIALGQPGTISGNANICAGSTETYSITAIGGASSYVWTLPNGWTGSSSSNAITVTTGATSGDIHVSAVNNCGASVPQTLTINSTVVDTSLVMAAATFTANATSGTYQWFDCIANQAINGETGQVFNATSNGSYSLIVNQNGCIASSTCYTISNLSLNEVRFEDQMKVFPNPSNGKISLLHLNTDKARIEILTTQGKVIYENTDLGGEINLENQPAGIYILRYLSGQSSLTTKLIIE